MADAPKLLPTDLLREGYPKINQGIDNANEALKKSVQAESNSTSAVNTANNAKTKVDNVQQQLNQLVIEGDSSVEAAAARIGVDNKAYMTLQDRLMSELGFLFSGNVRGLSGKKFKLIGGAIRNDGNGWGLVDDPTHKNVNLQGVYIDPNDDGRLRLDHNFNATTIGTLLLAQDETFAKMGLVGGNSGGKGFNLLEFAAPFSCQTAGTTTIVSAHKYHLPTTSITQLGDGNGFTVNHGAVATSDPPVVSIASDGTSSDVGGELRVSFNVSSVTVRYYQNAHGYIRYNSTTQTWDLSTNNIDKPTITWDSTNQAVKVAHATTSDTYALQITNVGDLLPYLYAQNSDSFLVRFKDFNGNVVTSPSSSMKFNFDRKTKVKSQFPSGLRCNIRRGLAKVKPANISEAFGNFWIVGLNESD